MLHIKSSFCKDYSFDGFSLEVCKLLRNAGIPFKIDGNSNVSEEFSEMISEFGVNYPLEDDFVLLMNPACFLKYYGVNSKTIIFTVWDSNDIPKEYINEINKGRMLIVPSKFMQIAFIVSGVSIPIEVIPHWFDEEIFNPSGIWPNVTGTRPSNKPFKFGASGQIIEEKNDKKDLSKIISAFNKAFGNQSKYSNVSLEVKITNDSLVTFVQNSKISLINDYYTDAQMSNWYRDLNCYVNLSKFESFGRQPMEVMACGIPIITANHSGLSDYYNDSLGYTVGHTLVDTKSNRYKTGIWYEANEDEVISRMRQVVNLGTDDYKKAEALKSISKYRKSVVQWNFIDLISRFAYV